MFFSFFFSGGWNNTKSVFRKEIQGNILEDTVHSPLDCNSLHSFWVTWGDSTVHVGTGPTVGKDEFITFNDTDPVQVNYFSVATGPNVTGYWVFHRGTLQLYR